MATDLVCFSHLRWDFVFQRPNHLMSRAARGRRVFYVEEPMPARRGQPDSLRATERHGVHVITPLLARGGTGGDGGVGRNGAGRDAVAGRNARLRRLLAEHLAGLGVDRPIHWLQTPAGLPLSEGLPRRGVVYDCMDDLTAFASAPPGLAEQERRLLELADLVITGGVSLQRRVAQSRPDALCLPSSIDLVHFRQALRTAPPADVVDLPRPRFGYAGVIDERLDMGLIGALASAYPSGSVILVGPVAKIDPSAIPVAPNIHQLGHRPYDDLPAYLGAWDVGIMPFARDRTTRYISPTKTPEYLAAGLPVASTGIEDVRSLYGRLGLVEIGDGPAGFVEACGRALATDLERHRTYAGDFLAPRSWDATWATIEQHLGTLERSLEPVAAVSAVASRPLASRPAASSVTQVLAGARSDAAVR